MFVGLLTKQNIAFTISHSHQIVVVDRCRILIGISELLIFKQNSYFTFFSLSFYDLPTGFYHKKQTNAARNKSILNCGAK